MRQRWGARGAPSSRLDFALSTFSLLTSSFLRSSFRALLSGTAAELSLCFESTAPIDCEAVRSVVGAATALPAPFALDTAVGCAEPDSAAEDFKAYASAFSNRKCKGILS